MEKLGAYIVPPVIILIVIFGAWKKVDLFAVFKEGAKEGLESLISIAPSLIGLIIAVNMLSVSGFFDLMKNILAPVCNRAGIPPEILPLAFIRPISGSGAMAVLSDILTANGPDSMIGKIASVMAGSTETTFYAVTVYYGAAGIKKTGYTIPAALCADLAGVIFSILFVSLF